MSILILFILIPLLSIIPILTAGNAEKARKAAIAGSLIITALSVIVAVIFFASGYPEGYNEYKFIGDITWFKSLNMHFVTGADNLTILMLLLASVSAMAGVTIPVRDREQKKEFYAAWMTMTAGINGYIVSLDLVMIYIFYMIALFPLLFVYVMRARKKEKLLPASHFGVLMGGAAILLVGILGIYVNSVPDGNELTFNILHIRDYLMPTAAQRVFAPMVIAGFGILGALFPFSILFPAGTSPSPPQATALFYGVTMKLGAYGALKLVIDLMPDGAETLSGFIIILSTAGAVYGAIGAFMAREMNKRLANMSVSVSCVLFIMLFLRIETVTYAAFILMIIHSVSVPLLLMHSAKTDKAV